jgi:hypothetical protein
MRQVIAGGVIGVALLVSGVSGWAATDQEQGDADGHHQHIDMMGSHDPQELVDGQQQTSDTVYVCPMHPEVRQAEVGRCPVCGMTLEAQPDEPTAADVEETEPEATGGHHH